MNEPEANAPDPGVLREEMINIVVGDGEGRIHRHAATRIVDAILQKQMMYYSQFATPELSAPVEEQMSAITEMFGLVNALIQQGARHTGVMTPTQLAEWQSVAARTRAMMERIAGLFT